MGRIVDNLIAHRILSMMVTNFEDTPAFKLGIIDKNGKNLRKASSLKTSEEKDSYTYLNRLVFNMKKIINKVGGESKLKSLVAALWLVKEQYENGSQTTAMLQEKFDKIIKMMDNDCVLVEEEIIVRNFLKEDAVANVTGAAVSTNEPKITQKHIRRYKLGQKSPIAGMARRPNPVS